MRTRTRILLALLVVGVIGGLTWRALKPREPEYHGKSLNQWLAQAKKAPDTLSFFYGTTSNAQATVQLQEASEALRQIGTNAIPALLQMLQKQDSPRMIKLWEFLSGQKFAKVRFDDGVFSSSFGHYECACVAHDRAALGFGFLGASASNAVPDLIRIYKKYPFRELRAPMIESLGFIGPTATDAIPLLMEAANGPDSLARLCGLRALGCIHSEPTVVVPLLIAELTNASDRVSARATAATALQHYGPAARQSVPALVEILREIKPDPYPSLSDYKNGMPLYALLLPAKQALREIDPETAAKVLGDKNEEKK